MMDMSSIAEFYDLPTDHVEAMAAYGSRHTKKRRTRADINVIKTTMYQLLQAEQPMTVRQVFYRMVGTGLIRKSETEYKATVNRLLTEMRLEGEIPFGWIADGTRWVHKQKSFDSVEQALADTARLYRRALWRDQLDRVEVWLEKEALAGVVYDVTDEYDVPLYVTRGYASLSYLHTAATMISDADKPTWIYYLGDHDPSGLDIPRNVEQRLREFAPDARFHFDRIAVTPEQIEAWSLPTRPTKGTDSRSASFSGESVEVDAIPPVDLRQLVTDAITAHIDVDALRIVQVAERSEREVLSRMAGVAA